VAVGRMGAGRAAAVLLGALSPFAVVAVVAGLQPQLATLELGGAAEVQVKLPEWPACERRDEPSGLPLAEARRVSSTVALARFSAGAVARDGQGAQSRTVAYVADEDARELRVIDHAAGRELAHHRLNGKPEQLLIADDGRVLVSLADRAEVLVLEPAQTPEAGFVERCRVPTAAEPAGMALTPDGKTLLVASRWGQSLSGHETQGEMRRRFELPLSRDPYGVVASSDGKRAFVSHVSGGQLSVIDLPKLAEQESAEPSSAVQRVALARKDWHNPFAFDGFLGALEMDSIGGLGVLDNGSGVASSEISNPFPRGTGGMVGSGRQNRSEAEPVIGFLGGGEGVLGTVLFGPPPPISIERSGTQGYALVATDDGRVMIPSVLTTPGKVGGGEVRGYGGGIGVAAATMVGVVASVDERSAKLTMPKGSRVGMMVRDCLLPRAAAWDADAGLVLVACQGVDAVIAYDHSADRPTRAEQYRFAVGKGPTGIAVDRAAKQVVVWSQFDASVTVAPLPPRGGTRGELTVRKADSKLRRADGRAEMKAPEPTRHALAHRGAPTAQVALGRQLFHESNHRRIAADGRACASCHPSGREDGLSWVTPEGPRQTPMLMSRLDESAPYGWNGKKKGLDAHLKRTLKRLGGTGLDASERAALVAYIGTMSTPRAASAQAPVLANLVKEGAALFSDASTGCVSCHVGDQTTDGIAHDVGSTATGDILREFDTPSLRHVAQTAPYYHDGRYATLEAMLSDEHMKMGQVDQLTAHEVTALAAYLRSL
jgi:DNA-binding beta-propeller fold protein YncE